jgi:hypothetical protein
MSAKALKIDNLDLDLINPRISKAGDQHEAMQRIIDDQDAKLGNLAESIVDNGLNPMDRLLVMKSESGNGKYTVLEGNRRAVALKILKNPNVLTGLDVRAALQKSLKNSRADLTRRPSSPSPAMKLPLAPRAIHGSNSGTAGRTKDAGLFAGLVLPAPVFVAARQRFRLWTSFASTPS